MDTDVFMSTGGYKKLICPSFFCESTVYIYYFLLIFENRLVGLWNLFTLKFEVMETTINTFGKLKEYKEKRVRELIRKYNVFLGIPWGLIIVICGICCLFFFLLLLFLFNLIHEDYSIWLFLFENLSLLFALIISLAFTILAIVKYIRSLQVP
jgi:hypothetical protein